jgi:tight adherence protein C
MVLLFLVGILLVGAAVRLVLRALALPQVRIAAQVQQIEAYGFQTPGVLTDAVPRSGTSRLAERLGRGLGERFPALKPLERRELLAAGIYGLTPEQLHGYRVMAATGIPAGLFALIALSGSVSALTVLMVVVTVAIAWVLPAARIRTRGQRRLDQIDRDLPELIDLLIATIEAGLGFGGSLQMVAQRYRGPLGEELRLTLQEQTMGLATDEALRHMLERADTPSMRSFVKTVLQGDALGVSVGSMLRNLAVETRQRRRALARERAQRAPIKLLFPLVFLIFPSMLLVLMYPTVHNLIQALQRG